MKKIYIKRIIQVALIICVLGLCTRTGKLYCKGYPVGTPIEEIEADLHQQLHEAGYLMPGDPGYDELVNGSSSSSSSTTSSTTTDTATSTQTEKKTVASCDHEYKAEEIKEATCVDAGEMKFTCTKCGDSYTEEVAPTGEHKYSYEETKSPTCTDPGENTFTCDVCGDSYTEEIPALGHDYTEKQTKAPTCTEAGEKTFTCANCGDTYTEPVEALGHTSDDGTVSKEASLFFDGEKDYRCINCGEVIDTEVIESTYPTYVLWIICGVAGAIVIAGIVFGILKAKKRI